MAVYQLDYCADRCAIVLCHPEEFNFYNVGYDKKEEMSLNIMLKISKMFHNGLPSIGVEELSDALSVPVRLVREVTKKLSDRGLLQEVFGDEITFQPAKNPGLISVIDVCYAMRFEEDVKWRVSND